MTNINKLKERYIALYGNEGVSENTLIDIEKKLNVKLPQDFREISLFYSGGLLGDITLYSIDLTYNPNIVDETIRLRNDVNLINNFIVLAEPPESLIVLSLSDNKVIWCDSVDVVRLFNNSFISKPEIWENYSSFFEKLLNDSENGF